MGFIRAAVLFLLGVGVSIGVSVSGVLNRLPPASSFIHGFGGPGASDPILIDVDSLHSVSGSCTEYRLQNHTDRLLYVAFPSRRYGETYVALRPSEDTPLLLGPSGGIEPNYADLREVATGQRGVAGDVWQLARDIAGNAAPAAAPGAVPPGAQLPQDAPPVPNGWADPGRLSEMYSTVQYCGGAEPNLVTVEVKSCSTSDICETSWQRLGDADGDSNEGAVEK